MPKQLNHPTSEELSAFSLGQLAPEQAAAVEAHITECQPCCETLLGVSDEDTFVALLKEADRAPDEVTVDVNLTSSSGSREDAAEIPPSLLEHARYRVVGLVGRGGMGDVYKAEHRMMERTVALKVINRDLISKPEAIARFHREVRAAARLSHPNIVTAYDAEQAGDVHFLAMEFVDGTELSEIVKQCGPMPVGEAVDYIQQAAAGLQHAHEMGMVHRDVKPQNLMLDASGNVKILDFGLAHFASESAAEVVGEEASDSAQPARVRHQLTQLGVMMGTPDYVAPEQARDARSADIRSDIYSLGCTLYYLLAGKVPFPGDSALDKLQAHTAGDLQPMRDLRSDLPEGLEDVLQKMMAQEPGERFQTPAEVSAALQPYLGTIESKLPLAKSAGAGNRKRFRWIAAAAAAAILFGVIVVMTDRGRIEIQSGVDDIEIVVSQDGRQVRVLDVASGTSVHWLHSGKYQLAARGDGTAKVTIGPDTVTIARFGKEIVRMTNDRNGDHGNQLEHVGQSTATKMFNHMTAKVFRRKDRALRLSDHRPVYLSGHVVKGEARFAAIWEQDPQAKFESKALVDLSPVQFQKVFDRLTTGGYRLTRISGYSLSGKQRYAGIFEQREGPAWQARMALPDHSFQRLFDELTDEGYRLIDVSGFSVGGKPHFASIWEKKGGPAWQARLDLSVSRFRKLLDQLTGEGYRPLRISGLVVDGKARYASIWEQDSDVQWQARVDMTHDEYASADKELAAKGFGKVQLCELRVDNEARYAVIWENRGSDAPAASNLGSSPRRSSAR